MVRKEKFFPINFLGSKYFSKSQHLPLAQVSKNTVSYGSMPAVNHTIQYTVELVSMNMAIARFPEPFTIETM